jgi:YidC/Oxa1 family membrane protein insertase
MERRLLIVFALTFLVIMLFQPLLKKYGPQPAPVKPETSQALPNQAQASSQPAQLPTQVSSSTAAKAATSAPLQAPSESETTIENDVYRIVFTNRGGRVKSWVLKKFTDDKGGPLELVNTAAAEKYGYPLTLWSYDEALRDKLNSVLYVATQTQAIGLGEGSATISVAAKGLEPASNTLTPPVEITFAYDDGDVSARKTYTFDRDSYVVGVKTAVYQKGAQVTAFPMWPAGFGADMTGAQYALGQIVYQYDDKVERRAIE